MFFLLILICLHTYHQKGAPHSYSPNYYNHDHHSGEEGAAGFAAAAAASGVFLNAGSKKLQQSSNYLPEEEGVKFLPVMR